MKKSELRQLIREEISNVKNEITSSQSPQKRYNSNKIKRAIESLEYNGYIVKQTHPNPGWSYMIKKPADIENKAGWAIGYNPGNEKTGDYFFYSSYTPDGKSWNHSHVDTGYKFNEISIRKVIDDLSKRDPEK